MLINMKKKILLFLVIIPAFLLIGCRNISQSSQDAKSNSNVSIKKDNKVIIKVPKVTVKNKKTKVSYVKSSESLENKNAQENFYGNWMISKLLATGPVLDHDISELKAIIGKQITYSKDYVKYDTNTYYTPFYKRTIENKYDFESGNRVMFKQLDFDGENIVKVNIYTDSQYKNDLNSIGNVFYINDDNSLILYAMGGYFKLTKANELVRHGGENIIDKNRVKVGDKISGLTVKSIDIHDGNLQDISFTGNLQVSGNFEWEDTGDGQKCIIRIDDAYKDSIPLLKGINNLNSIVINNNVLAQKLLPQQGGKAVVIVNNYSLGERQIPVTADIEKVILIQK